MNTKTDNNINKVIDDKIKNGYEIDLGNIVDTSLENFKKIVWVAGLGYFLVFALLIILTIIGVSQFVNPEELKELSELLKDPTYLENNPNFHLYNFITIVSIGILFAPLNAGFINLCRLADENKSISISNLFIYYGNRKSIDIIFGTLLVSLISFGISLGLELANLKLVSFVVSISISLFTFIFIPLIIFADQNAIQAISKSSKLIMKSPFTVLGAMALAFLIALAGLMALCIGILFTIPYMYSVQYTIYKNIIGFEEVEKEEITL